MGRSIKLQKLSFHQRKKEMSWIDTKLRPMLRLLLGVLGSVEDVFITITARLTLNQNGSTC